jgi:HEAT repeat protein
MLSNSSEQRSNVAKIIERGWHGVQQDDWSLVNYCLKQLPLTRNQVNAPQVGELAIQVLLNGDFQEKWEVAKIFPLLDRSIVPCLIEIVHNENLDEEIRWFACRILGAFPEPEAIASIALLLQTATAEELTLVACQTLTQMDTHAIKVLRDLLSQPKHRLLAVTALSQIRHPAIVTPLLSTIDDANPQIRTIAIVTLATFHDSRILPVLIHALKDTAAAVRKEAAIALGVRQNSSKSVNLVEYLQPLLYDLNLEVCRQAAIALGRIKQESAVNALFQILKSPHTPAELKIDTVRALSWSELEPGLEYLQQALAVETENICQEIIAVLGRISKPSLKLKATQILINFYHDQLKHQDLPRLKQTLASSLGILGHIEARSSLEQLARDLDRKVQLHATAALEKL